MMIKIYLESHYNVSLDESSKFLFIIFIHLMIALENFGFVNFMYFTIFCLFLFGQMEYSLCRDKVKQGYTLQ